MILTVWSVVTVFRFVTNTPDVFICIQMYTWIVREQVGRSSLADVQFRREAVMASKGTRNASGIFWRSMGLSDISELMQMRLNTWHFAFMQRDPGIDQFTMSESFKVLIYVLNQIVRYYNDVVLESLANSAIHQSLAFVLRELRMKIQELRKLSPWQSSRDYANMSSAISSGQPPTKIMKLSEPQSMGLPDLDPRVHSATVRSMCCQMQTTNLRALPRVTISADILDGGDFDVLNSSFYRENLSRDLQKILGLDHVRSERLTPQIVGAWNAKTREFIRKTYADCIHQKLPDS